MSYQNTAAQITGIESAFFPTAFAVAPDLSQVAELTNSDTAEVLEFLAVRPVHTVAMTGFINDNGIRSSLNRGTFYGFRGDDGRLEGVALIGHSTLVEARTDAAMRALAFQAKSSRVPVHLIMSGNREAEEFWNYFSDGLHQPRLSNTELLFEVSFPYLVHGTDMEIRPARPDELLPVAEAHAELALLECGVDPMETDRDGFLKRVRRRIGQGRVFVAVQEGELIFKADIIAETPEVIYLEGVYVAPSHRGRGIGSGCLAKLTLDLLKRSQNICMLSNINFIDAHMSYLKAGYKNTGNCTTLFV